MIRSIKNSDKGRQSKERRLKPKELSNQSNYNIKW